MRYATRTDNNQADIVAHFRALGASVFILKLPVDLLIGHNGKTALVDVKNPETCYGRRGANDYQAEFLKNWRGGTVAFIDSKEAASRLLKVMEHD